MGLAASQARLIALTARKNNVEYEGQQINQQRLQLSNQMSELYNQLLETSVPTPPSLEAYTKLEYWFQLGTRKMNISDILPDGDTFTVVASYQRPGSTMDFASQLNIVAREDEETGALTYTIGGTSPIYTLEEAMAQDPPMFTEERLEGFLDAIRHTWDKYSDPNEYPNDRLMQLFSVGYPTVSNVDRAVSSLDTTPHFMETSDVQSARPEDDYHWIYSWSYTATSTYTENVTYTGCLIDFDANGNASTISIPGSNQMKTYSLFAESVTNQAEYDEAFRQYQYAKDKYDKEQEAINAKTKIIQQQDKNLELKLTRLNNEQNALKTEMEAVEKVIKDNVDKGFKTFSG